MFRKIKAFLFQNTSTKQTFAKNTLWLTVSQVIGRITRALIVVYAARVLGAAGWGLFAYATSLVAFLAVFADFGLNPIVTRDAARTSDPEERKRIFATALGLRLISVFIAALLVLFVAPRIISLKDAVPLLPFAALILIFDGLREFGFALGRAIERMEIEAVILVVLNALIAVGGFIILAAYPTPKAFTFAYMIGTAVGLALTALAFRKYYSSFFSHFSKQHIKPLLLAGWPFALTGLLGLLLINTDMLIIGQLGTATDVGLYSAAERIIQILYVLPGVLGLATLPIISRLATANRPQAAAVVSRVTRAVFLFAFPIAFGGFFVSAPLVTFLFGSEYARAALPFAILSLTLAIDFPTIIVKEAIFACNEQRRLVIYAAIAGFSNVLLDLLLIPSFGITGAAFATLFAQMASVAYLWYTLRRVTHLTIRLELKNIIIATCVMVGAVVVASFLPIHVLGIIAIGFATYFVMLVALKEPLFAEVRLLTRRALETTGGPAA